MPRPSRMALFAALALAPALGCGELPNLQATTLHQTPESVLEPRAPAEPKPAPAAPKGSDKAKDADGKKAAPVKSAAVAPTFRTVGFPGDDAAKENGKSKDTPGVTLATIKIDDLVAQIAADKKAKFTVVDVWSTTCAPCMENFPHVVQMHAKYGPRGLKVISLATDDPEDAKTLDRARAFLTKQKATMSNFVDAEYQSVFEKFDFNAMPAVLLFGPGGKLLRKYTWDDPYNQFTYDQVEKDVQAVLDGKPLPPPPKRKAEKG